MVSGGVSGDDILDTHATSTTETLVEGGQSWTLGESLPSARWGLRGVSLPNTIIMTGKNVHSKAIKSKKEMCHYCYNKRLRINFCLFKWFPV